jgi:hypothetical protein
VGGKRSEGVGGRRVRGWERGGVNMYDEEKGNGRRERGT